MSINPRASMHIIHKLYSEGPQWLRLYVRIPLSANVPPPQVFDVALDERIMLRAAFREELNYHAPAAICESCRAMNVDVLLRDDDEIETHRKIHEAITQRVRYE